MESHLCILGVVSVYYIQQMTHKISLKVPALQKRNHILYTRDFFYGLGSVHILNTLHLPRCRVLKHTWISDKFQKRAAQRLSQENYCHIWTAWRNMAKISRYISLRSSTFLNCPDCNPYDDGHNAAWGRCWQVRFLGNCSTVQDQQALSYCRHF